MKKLLAVTIFGFTIAFKSFSAPTSAEQLRGKLESVKKVVSKGQEQVFDVSYETVTNRLFELKPNPKADAKPPGAEIVPGQAYELVIIDGPSGSVSENDTTILVTRIDPKTTRVQLKTIKLGLIFDSHDWKIEKQRLNELAQLLSNNN